MKLMLMNTISIAVRISYLTSNVDRIKTTSDFEYSNVDDSLLHYLMFSNKMFVYY